MPDPGCGDGFREDPELCDDGNQDESDLCTTECQLRDVRVVDDAPVLSGVDGGIGTCVGNFTEDGECPSLPARRLGDGRHPVAAGDDGFAVAFIEPDGELPAVRLALFTSVGERLAVADVSAGSIPVQLADPSVAALPGGAYAVAWTDFGGDGNGLGIALRRVEGDGTLGPLRYANANTNFGQFEADVIWTGDELLVAWADDRELSTSPDLFHRLFDEHLQPLDPSELALAKETQVEGAAALARYKGTEWAASWRVGHVVEGTETISVVTSTGVEWETESFWPAVEYDRPTLAELDDTHLLVLFSAGTDPSGAAGISTVGRIFGAVLDVNAPGTVTPFDLGPSEPHVWIDRPVLANVTQVDPAPDRLFVAARTVRGATGDDVVFAELEWDLATDPTRVNVIEDFGALNSAGLGALGDQRRPAIAPTPLPPLGAFAAAWEDFAPPSAFPKSQPDVMVHFRPVPGDAITPRPPFGSEGYCESPQWICGLGEGDCDSHVECEEGLVCGTNKGSRFGFHGDACVPEHCTNGVFDGDETLVDCGGSCGDRCDFNLWEDWSSVSPPASTWPSQWSHEVLTGDPINWTTDLATFSPSNNLGVVFSPQASMQDRSIQFIDTAGATAINVEQLVKISVSVTGQDALVGLIARRSDASPDTYYGVGVGGNATFSRLRLFKVVNGVGPVVLSHAGPTPPFGERSLEPQAWNMLRFSVTQAGGGTDLRAKLWLASEPEPEGWTLEVSGEDEPALQGLSGRVGAYVRAHAFAPRRVYFDDYLAQDLLAAPAPPPRDCEVDADCEPGLICAPLGGVPFGFHGDACVPPHCVNNTRDGDEAFKDCGGACGPICPFAAGDCHLEYPCSLGGADCDAVDYCMPGLECKHPGHGEYGGNLSNPCVPVHCENGVLDPGETAIDQGGECGEFWTPHCTDGIESGDETGVDCGGSCPRCDGPQEGPVEVARGGVPLLRVAVSATASPEVRQIAEGLRDDLEALTGARFIVSYDGSRGIRVGLTDDNFLYWGSNFPDDGWPYENLLADSAQCGTDDYVIRSIQPWSTIAIGGTTLTALQNAVDEFLLHVGYPSASPIPDLSAHIDRPCATSLASHCTNGVLDAADGELGIDCGGECGTCAP